MCLKKSGNLLFLFFLFYSFTVAARPVVSSLTPVQNKTQKHFDLDRNKSLDPYERLLLRTHEVMKYPLANKKKMLPYDYNQDRMLEPFEHQKYLRDKQSGDLNTVYQKFRDKKKQAKIKSDKARLGRVKN